MNDVLSDNHRIVPVDDNLDSLVATATRAAQWSTTANLLKAAISRARWTTFTLSMLGATAATIAGQIPAADTNLRNWFAGAGAVALAVVTFVTGRLLTANRTSSWIQVRAAAEALKREAFRYATRAAPYEESGSAAALLDDARQRIDATVAAIRPSDDGRCIGGVPNVMLSREDYRSRRVKGQITWYRGKSRAAVRQAKFLRLLEFSLALTATIIVALSTVTGKQLPFVGINFDIASLAALLTTLAGAVLSHIEASRLDYLALSYSAAARRLDDLDVTYARVGEQPQAWSAFVNRCEDILAAENQSWIAKWGPALLAAPGAN
jgi:hypothetical protein